MCFWNYRLQKAWLLKCLKSPLSEHLWTGNMLKGLKDFKILRLFLNILTLCDKYSLFMKWVLNATNSNAFTSKIEKMFLNFFLNFLDLHQILNILKNKWHSRLMYLRNYRLKKTWLLKCLKAMCQNNYRQSTSWRIQNTTEICNGKVL